MIDFFIVAAHEKHVFPLFTCLLYPWPGHPCSPAQGHLPRGSKALVVYTAREETVCLAR